MSTTAPLAPRRMTVPNTVRESGTDSSGFAGHSIDNSISESSGSAFIVVNRTDRLLISQVSPDPTCELRLFLW